MKKLILIPIALTTLTPMVSMVACNDSEPKYINIEVENNESTDFFKLEKNKYYKFYNDCWGSYETDGLFCLIDNDHDSKVIDASVIKVETDGVKTDYTIEKDTNLLIKFQAKKQKSYEIYIKANETIDNCCGALKDEG